MGKSVYKCYRRRARCSRSSVETSARDLVVSVYGVSVSYGILGNSNNAKVC